MKTPKDILLAHHQQAIPKLDALRLEVTAQLRANAQADSRGWLTAFWTEAIAPWKKAWIGIATAWVAIVAVNLATGTPSIRGNPTEAKTDPQVRLVLREQRMLLTQLLGPAEWPLPAEPVKSGPRSDVKIEEAIV